MEAGGAGDPALAWLLDRAARGEAAPGEEQALGELLRRAGGARALGALGRARLALSALRRRARAPGVGATGGPGPADVDIALEKLEGLGHSGAEAWRAPLARTGAARQALASDGPWTAAVLVYVEQAARALPTAALPESPEKEAARPSEAGTADPIEMTPDEGAARTDWEAPAVLGKVSQETLDRLRGRVRGLQARGDADPLGAAREAAAKAGVGAPKTPAGDPARREGVGARSSAALAAGGSPNKKWSMMHVQEGAQPVLWEGLSDEEAAAAETVDAEVEAGDDARADTGDTGAGGEREEDHRQRRRRKSGPILTKKRGRVALDGSVQEPVRADRRGAGSRVRWSEDETKLLVDLVDQYGKKWSRIHLQARDVWARNGRTQVDLKDKFRNLVNKQKV